MEKDIQEYHQKQEAGDQEICRVLFELIDKNLPGAKNKIWHSHPVWFFEGNPIVGYHKLKNSVRLLFWSGQSFEEEQLKPEGSF